MGILEVLSSIELTWRSDESFSNPPPPPIKVPIGREAIKVLQALEAAGYSIVKGRPAQFDDGAGA